MTVVMPGADDPKGSSFTLQMAILDIDLDGG